MIFELEPVEPIHNRRIPARYDIPHAVAMQFHDILALLVVDLEKRGLLQAALSVSPEEAAQLEPLNGEALWSWLVQTGRDEVVADLTYRQLTAALCADACHFLIESLLACGKGKTAVAYSLLRKPFKENLLLLEWLAADPGDFLAVFNGTTSYPYAPNRLPEARRRQIIREAADATDPSQWFDHEFMYDVRYSKTKPYGLEQLWTKSTHLVTTVKSLATEPGNLNFVFSTPSAIEEQWEFYYTIVPMLTAYLLAVAEAVASRFVEWDEEKRGFQRVLRTIALLRSVQAISGNDSSELDDLLQSLEPEGLECRACGSHIELREANVDRLWSQASVACGVCGAVHDLWATLFPGGGN